VNPINEEGHSMFIVKSLRAGWLASCFLPLACSASPEEGPLGSLAASLQAGDEIRQCLPGEWSAADAAECEAHSGTQVVSSDGCVANIGRKCELRSVAGELACVCRVRVLAANDACGPLAFDDFGIEECAFPEDGMPAKP
jgi:hypothetical protein